MCMLVRRMHINGFVFSRSTAACNQSCIIQSILSHGCVYSFSCINALTRLSDASAHLMLTHAQHSLLIDIRLVREVGVCRLYTVANTGQISRMYAQRCAAEVVCTGVTKLSSQNKAIAKCATTMPRADRISVNRFSKEHTGRKHSAQGLAVFCSQ